MKYALLALAALVLYWTFSYLVGMLALLAVGLYMLLPIVAVGGVALFVLSRRRRR